MVVSVSKMRMTSDEFCTSDRNRASLVARVASSSFTDATRRTSTRSTIVTAMNAVKKYNEEINAYLSCLETESESQIAAIAEPTPEQIKQIKGIQTAKHNAAVDELEKYATKFNAQLKAYKAKNPG